MEKKSTDRKTIGLDSSKILKKLNYSMKRYDQNALVVSKRRWPRYLGNRLINPSLNPRFSEGSRLSNIFSLKSKR